MCVCVCACVQVLGVGIPLWQPLDPNNLLYGGVQIQHMGVPPTYVPRTQPLGVAVLLCARHIVWMHFP